MRLDPVLLVSLAAVAGGALCVQPAPVLALSGLALALAVRCFSWSTLAISVLVLGSSATRASLEIAAFEARWATARQALDGPRRCSALAEVRASPTRVRGQISWLGALSSVDCEGRALPEGTLARLYGGPAELGRGDRAEVVVQLAPVQWFRNLDLPDPVPGAARRGAAVSGMVLAADRVEQGTGWSQRVDRARARVRRRIDATFAPQAAPLARALVLGENDLDAEDDEAFRRSGLSHLLAVSGTHLVLAVATLVRMLTALLVRLERLAVRVDVGRVAAAFGIPLALGYADFAGGSGSAWRAAWMLAAAYAARVVGRHPRPVRTLALSFLVGALGDPLVVFDISFLLSGAATAGLLVLGRPLGATARRVPWHGLRAIASSVATTLSAMVPCIPLLAVLSPDLTLAGVFANVVAAPLGELVALPVCLLHPLTEAWPPLERGAAMVGSGALLAVRAVARLSASARFLALAIPAPSAWHFAVLSLGVFALWLGRGARRSVALTLAGLVVAELVQVSAGRPAGLLRVSVLDVGQGDAILVDLPNGALMLVDGGGFAGQSSDPGRRVILPVLRARRRSRIDVMVLTHPHPDHIGGLASVLASVAVGELWHAGTTGEPPGRELAALLGEAGRRGIPVRDASELCAVPRAWGSASVTPLAPCPGPVQGRDANDNSIVLRLALGARAALLMGDAEAAEEAELLERGVEIGADLIKVGHHGSRTSSSVRLLARVSPTVAIVSSGVRNRFGHPHAETVTALSRRKIHTLRTDLAGEVRWTTDGSAVWLALARPGPRPSGG